MKKYSRIAACLAGIIAANAIIPAGTAYMANTQPNAPEFSNVDENVDESRQIVDFNSGWIFSKLNQGDLRTGGEVKEPTAEQLKNREDIKTAAFAKSDYDTTGWENVVLPHTWNAVDGANGWKEEKTERNDFDGGGVAYYRGVGVYRKNVEFGGEYSGKENIY